LTDSDSNNLDLFATSLLVPPELSNDAESILSSATLQRAFSASIDKTPTGNVLNGRLKVATEPRLSNAVKFPNASPTAYYMFPQAIFSSLVVAFLGGVENPVVEPIMLPSDELGIGYRSYVDVGAALVDKLGAMAFSGAA